MPSRLRASREHHVERAAGLDGATVEVLATKPGKASELRIAHVAIDGVAVLARAFGEGR